MSCRLYRALVSEALDGAVTRDEERILAAHLALCRSCQELQTDLAEMRLLLRSDVEVEAGPELEAELFSRVRASDEGPLATLWKLVKHVLPGPGLVPSTAVAALLMLALAMLVTENGPPVRPPVLSAPTLLETSPLRDPGLLTVWDSGGDRIVATVDPGGEASDDIVRRASFEVDEVPHATGAVMQVRIVLFQRIVVRG